MNAASCCHRRETVGLESELKAESLGKDEICRRLTVEMLRDDLVFILRSCRFSNLQPRFLTLDHITLGSSTSLTVHEAALCFTACRMIFNPTQSDVRSLLAFLIAAFKGTLCKMPPSSGQTLDCSAHSLTRPLLAWPGNYAGLRTTT